MMDIQPLMDSGFALLFLIMTAIVIMKKQPEEGKEGRVENRGRWLELMSRDHGKWEKCAFAILFLMALALRLWRFGQIPVGMNQDGAMAAVEAKALADYGTDIDGMFLPTHFTAWGYAQMNVFLSYCMIPFIKLFGLNAVTARLPLLIFSMMGLAALYFMGRKLAGVCGAQVMLVFAALNPWHFMQSRWALESNMLPHVFLLGWMLMLKGIEGKKRWLWASMACFGLSMYCYGIAFYTVPVFLLIMAAYLLAKKLVSWRDVILSVGIYALISWPIYLTMMINAFHWETIRTFFCTMPFFPKSVRSKDILFFSEDVPGQFLNNFKALVDVYWSGDTLPWNTVPGFGVIQKCFLPLTYLGLLVCIRRARKETEPGKRAGYVACLLVFLIGNVSGLITASVNVNRINFLHYSLLILTGLGILYCIQTIKASAVLILPVFLIMSATFLPAYYSHQEETAKSTYYGDFIDAVRYAADGEWTDCQSFVITPDTQYVGAKYVTEILTMYALEVDAKYRQGEGVDENGLTYKEKFRYSNPRLSEMDPDRPVAFVVRTAALDLNSLSLAMGSIMDEYAFEEFGEYTVILPWKNILLQK